MNIDVATAWPDLAQRMGEWSALLDRSSSNDPTLSPLWLEPWWQVFGPDDGRALRSITVDRGGRLIGLAPLLVRPYRHRGVVPVRRVELLGSGEAEEDEICSDYLNVIAEAGKEPLVARAVVRALIDGAIGSWDELCLDYLDRAAPMTGALIRQLERAGCRVEIAPRGQCLYTPLPNDWDTLLKQLSSDGRYLARRALRDLGKWAGDEIELVQAESTEDLARGRDILIDLHGQRWGAAGRPGGVFASTRFTAFHDRVMPALLERGALDLLWLVCKGEPVAAVYNVVWNGKVYFYQSG
ncbi:MAG: GNAT family N-acetyltransferase, partial [Myxococcota bacterium]